MPPEIQNKKIVLDDLAKMEFNIKEIYWLIARTMIAMSWGINSPANYRDRVLFFKVQWFLLKGYVYISLEYDDTFTVYFTKKDKVSVIRIVKWVYIDQLIDIIDHYVEKNVSDEEYKKLISNI